MAGLARRYVQRMLLYSLRTQGSLSFRACDGSFIDRMFLPSLTLFASWVFHVASSMYLVFLWRTTLSQHSHNHMVPCI
jgi:hypothetical protein